ncbi:hypothetical protein PENCOP_c015G00757 [Penicillium coprophilum]|uniref:Carrier domain-containing protein n=1 Tax=Penicillium coprophilum TaxID=36646 RepID=A0A1V6U9P5_9EURO|nr:hypothetical protein PENCOP_c015G00757 [Penicillium coprophilum]
MSSQATLAKVLMGAEPCHFPSLVHDPVTSPTTQILSRSLALPKISRPGSNAEGLTDDEVCKLAFVLLLKAYVRTDDVSCISLTRGSQALSEHGLIPLTVNLLEANLNVDASLLDNIQNVTTTSLGDVGALEQELRRIEAETGSRPFNTTLYLTKNEAYEESLKEKLHSNFILHIDRHVTTTAGNQITVTLSYNTEFLDQWYAENILATFETILQTIKSDINSQLKSLDLISTRDKQKIHSWNAEVPLYVHQTLNDQFQQTFSQNPDKEAVWTTEGSLTYREIDDLSTILAVRLIKLGVKPNTVVPIFMSKSRWSVCAIASVWKAGGAIATMDPAYPNERLFAIINEFKAKVIISDPVQRPRFGQLNVHVVDDLESLPDLFKLNGLPVSRTEAWNMSGVKPKDLAVVAFTSGSSGRPKGVLHSHDRLTSEHQSYIWNVEYTGESRIVQFASYAYIASVGETQRSFSHGATLCVPSEEERMSSLVDFISRSRATRSYLTPSVARTINPKDVPSLKILCVGGESIPKDLEEIWGPYVHFIQVYGATEGGFLARDRTSKNHNKKGLCPVGGLVWLVDRQNANQLVPVGAVGEIVFESHELALGYLNDPEKSAKTFLDTPTWALGRPEAVGCRYLRNGDMGRYEADGSVSIYGRADTQVKINGQRVELGDVEANLRILLPSEWGVVVELVKPFDAPDRPILTAFVSPARNFQGDSRVTFSDAKARLESLLPRHMIPRACVIVDQIPGNYKTDRKKLRTEGSELGYKKLLLSLQGDSSSERPIPPENEKELVLADLWATLLRQDLDIVGRHQDFISLGGDSLAAIKLVSAARERNLQLTAQQILSQPILEDMANCAIATDTSIEDDTSMGDGLHENPPAKAGSNDTVALVSTDFQAWAALVGSANGGWIDHFTYDFSGKIDQARLEKSCKELFEAHSILRGVFELQGHQVIMKITSGAVVPFDTHEVELEGLDSKTREIYEKNRISPLGSLIVRFDLIKVSPVRYRLVMRLSHAQYDGFCAETFEKHLKLLYFSQPLPSTLPFENYISSIQDPDLVQAASKYWRNHLQGSRMPKLVERSGGIPRYINTLDGEFKSSVVIPSLRDRGISMTTIVKAAWGLTISALSHSTDIVFGDFISGRQTPIPHIETVVGPCVNFTPLRIQLSQEFTNAELLGNVQRDLIAAIPHESLGFKHIIRDCTDWGVDARYSSIVNFLHLEEEDSGTHPWTIDGHEESQVEVDSLYEEKQHDKTDLWLLCRRVQRTSKELDLESGFTDHSETFDLYFRYSTALYQNGAIERIASLYNEAMDSLVTRLDDRVRVLRISEEEKALLVPVCN